MKTRLATLVVIGIALVMTLSVLTSQPAARERQNVRTQETAAMQPYWGDVSVTHHRVPRRQCRAVRRWARHHHRRFKRSACRLTVVRRYHRGYTPRRATSYQASTGTSRWYSTSKFQREACIGMLNNCSIIDFPAWYHATMHGSFRRGGVIPPVPYAPQNYVWERDNNWCAGCGPFDSRRRFRPKGAGHISMCRPLSEGMWEVQDLHCSFSDRRDPSGYGMRFHHGIARMDYRSCVGAPSPYHACLPKRIGLEFWPSGRKKEFP